MGPDMPGAVTIGQFDTYFQAGVNAQDLGSDTSYVQTFMGRPALAIDVVNENPLTMTEMNAHPFGVSEGGNDLPASQDPTRRAVIISTSVGEQNSAS